ncbi:MAG TPA: FAD-linked oxidase C-terminal domain-containing protein [Mycobacteriales bacterium]|nr:FAD-linked oxidase C-terminal domain-containing protein [Mycobacteriales bacterium]
MTGSGALDALVAALPDGTLVTDPARLQSYRWDRANDPDVGTPLAIVRPRTTGDVSETLRIASLFRTPVVARGAGTGLSGGASAVDGCIVVSTEQMRTVEVDPRTRTVRVQPGALNVKVKAAAAAHGLWYPPDPSSYEICSIGGNIATNAGGLCCVKYGVTTDYVLGLTVVLADGSVVELGGPRLKDTAGLSLTKLFVGSEGTLGIVTEAILRLVPQPPPAATLVATYSRLDDATDTVADITARIRPSMLEFMDRTSINAVEDVTRMGLDRDAEALLVIQSDQPGAAAEAEIADIERICAVCRASEVFATTDTDAGESFVAARRMAIPAVERRGSLLLEDVGVPIPALGALVRGIAAIAQRRDVEIAVIAHAGDGNTHPLIVCDRTNAAELTRAQVAYGEIMELAIDLDGTITGEHGVGRLKRPWLDAYLGPTALALNQRIKDALDPLGILNPGAVFEPAHVGQEMTTISTSPTS